MIPLMGDWVTYVKRLALGQLRVKMKYISSRLKLRFGIELPSLKSGCWSQGKRYVTGLFMNLLAPYGLMTRTHFMPLIQSPFSISYGHGKFDFQIGLPMA